MHEYVAFLGGWDKWRRIFEFSKIWLLLRPDVRMTKLRADGTCDMRNGSNKYETVGWKPQ
jgi:hypothetical protein